MNATANDHAALIQFAADLAEVDWNPDYTPNAKCRAGNRLVKHGWLIMHKPACRSTSTITRGTYHAPTYALTNLGQRALVAAQEMARA